MYKLYDTVVQNFCQSPSFYQGLPCFLPTSPATALFGWCRHELNIQSMDGVGTHPTHPQTCRALVARSSANFTPTANPLLANLFHSLPSCKTSRSYLDALLQAVHRKQKKKLVKICRFCPISAQTSFVPPRHSLVCLIHPWLSKEFSAPRAKLPQLKSQSLAIAAEIVAEIRVGQPERDEEGCVGPSCQNVKQVRKQCYVKHSL